MGLLLSVRSLYPGISSFSSLAPLAVPSGATVCTVRTVFLPRGV